MGTHEANRVIAEYMGVELKIMGGTLMYLHAAPILSTGLTYRQWKRARFHESLDALVPVWEKLKCIEIKIGDNDLNQCIVRFACDDWVWSDGETPQNAACIATAIAIEQLK